MNKNVIIQLMGIVLTIYMTVSCQNSVNPPIDSSYVEQVPIRFVDFPIAEHASVLWFPETKIVVGTFPEFGSIRYFLVQNQERSEVLFKADVACDGVVHHKLPERLPDGRLGLMIECNSDKPPYRSEVYLVTYDWRTQELEFLTNTINGNEVGPSFYTWNPEMTKGVIQSGSLVSTLYWIDSGGLEIMNIELSNGQLTWSLADPDPGMTRSPAWSPDGETLAFFASSEAIGRQGFGRARSSSNLYFLDISTGKTRLMLDQIYPDLLEWSPDGEWLAISAGIGSVENSGLWLYSPANHALKRITESMVGDISWSPQGTEIVALRGCEDECEKKPVFLSVTNQSQPINLSPNCISCDLTLRKVVIYDVSTIVSAGP